LESSEGQGSRSLDRGLLESLFKADTIPGFFSLSVSCREKLL